MIIFFDLDGPIIDVSHKYYAVYYDLMKSRRRDVISKDDYWNYKKEQLPEKEILKLTNSADIFEWYKDERVNIIETEKYIALDILHHNCENVLQTLYEKNDLVLCTLRTSAHQLKAELQSFNIEKYFLHILNSNAEIDPRWKVKYDLIISQMPEVKIMNTVFIGDTETDLLAGKNLGATTIGVKSGIRTEEKLKKYNPDYLIDSIDHLLSIEIFSNFT